MIRLYRILPLLLVMAVIAGVVYIVMSFRYSSNHAKAMLIKVFFWLTSILGAIFLIITLYALFEHNDPVTELAGSCLLVCLIGFGITYLCRHIFLKNNPNFGEEVTNATVINTSIIARFGEAFRKALGDALKETFSRGGK